MIHRDVTMLWLWKNKGDQCRRFRRVSGCGRETPSGGNTGILASADHLHALKAMYHTTGEGKPQMHNRAI